MRLRLSSNSDEGDILHRYSWETLRDEVCLPDCILKELRLDNLQEVPDERTDSQAATNTSVKSLTVLNTNQSLVTLMGVVRMFKSLEHLDMIGGDFSKDDLSALGELLLPMSSSLKSLSLSHCQIRAQSILKIIPMLKSLVHLDISGCDYSADDLSVLDELLLSDSACLESLCMSQCHIGEESMMAFVRKLERMRVLKVLVMRDNPFTHSEHCVTALKEALWKNTSLQFVSIGGKLPQSIVEKYKLTQYIGGLDENTNTTQLSSSEILPLCLNQAGRGALQLTYHDMEAGLLPKILERAGKLNYHTSGTAAEGVKKDVGFWLLRHMMIAQLSP